MKTFVRQISTEDVDALIDVASDSWNWTYREIYSKDFIDNWIRENYSRESLLGEITKSKTDPEVIFLVAFIDSKLTGFIELKVENKKAVLLRLYLKPEYTRRGIGKSLLMEAEKIMKKMGVAECTLSVHRRNEIGISFYIKQGFNVKRIEEDDYVMAKKYESQE
ncbi:MAG: GNAT family N-acetyltransferase [Thermoplasmataceae archaeon]|jgi:ribosomal protein S18 acetylase RimI-like enzyme